MKSRMFASRGARAGYRNNSSFGTAGQSRSNKPSGEDGYMQGMAGGRAGRSGGGKSMSAMTDRPMNNAAIQGDGGWAWDKSMPYMREDGEQRPYPLQVVELKGRGKNG